MDTSLMFVYYQMLTSNYQALINMGIEPVEFTICEKAIMITMVALAIAFMIYAVADVSIDPVEIKRSLKKFFKGIKKKIFLKKK